MDFFELETSTIPVPSEPPRGASESYILMNWDGKGSVHWFIRGFVCYLQFRFLAYDPSQRFFHH